MIAEDLDLFFADFGVSFVAGAVSGMCLKDAPGVAILDDQILSVDGVVLVKTSEFGALLYGDTVAVDGIAYVVKNTKPVEDGAFSLVMLERLDGPPPPIPGARDVVIVLDGDFV